MYVCLYTLCMHLCIYAYLYICIHMNSSMSVCVYVRSGRGNLLYRRGSCSGVSCPGVSCPGGGRGPFPMRRRARDLVPYSTMYTSAFISVRQQALKAPAYEGVSKCIFSCFIYYGVKVNVRLRSVPHAEESPRSCTLLHYVHVSLYFCKTTSLKSPSLRRCKQVYFSCFIYYGVKVNVRSFGVNSIQMLFISQTRNSKLS